MEKKELASLQNDYANLKTKCIQIILDFINKSKTDERHDDWTDISSYKIRYPYSYHFDEYITTIGYNSSDNVIYLTSSQEDKIRIHKVDELINLIFKLNKFTKGITFNTEHLRDYLDNDDAFMCFMEIYEKLKTKDNLMEYCVIPKKYLKCDVFPDTISPLVKKKLLIIGNDNRAIINVETIRLIEQIFDQE